MCTFSGLYMWGGHHGLQFIFMVCTVDLSSGAKNLRP